MARRLRNHCHGMKLKIQSVPTVWFSHPPIPKKTVKKKKKILITFFFYFVDQHFFQHRLLGLVGDNWAQLCWQIWWIIFLLTSMLNVHVSPMRGAHSRCGWLPNESTKLPIQNGTHHLLYTNRMLVNSSRFWTNVYRSPTSANQLPLLLDKNKGEVGKHHLLVARFSVWHCSNF